ncbi:tetratricopeptide repeat protein [Marinigracilibium pacificum]|uniref:Tetratricopeptide repeat protein n=1 Tax=Marinigracilibium pacificum TaxID=2729599 RepID=A0A848IW61_9BACT|nr:tetratricopeptide repeat protein [Marinigracilibium pacificum]NMM47926.1 tetratricopeptide repeat protein [Marinigracilibium pacificum]
MEFLLDLALIYVLVIIAGAVTTIVHEMGHAIAGLLVFKGPIHVYIGSYGKSDSDLNLNLGRLKISFKYKLHYWRGGLCIAGTPEKSLVRLYLFTLCGPVASLIIAITALLFLIYSDIQDVMFLGTMVLLVSASIDFLRNIIPEPNPIILDDGGITFNDGQTLKYYREFKDVYNEILTLSQLYQSNEFEEGLKFFSSLENPETNKHLASIGSAFLIKLGRDQEAIDLMDKSKKHKSNKKWTADQYINYALAHAHLEKYEKALEYYDKSLKLNPNCFVSLNNKAYTFTIIGKYKEAIEDANKAIEINPAFAFSYNNRGLAKIKIGNKEDGLIDIYKSIELDDKNSYAYKNLGIYHLENDQLELAIENFNKANELDPKTEGLEELIIEANKKVLKEI